MLPLLTYTVAAAGPILPEILIGEVVPDIKCLVMFKVLGWFWVACLVEEAPITVLSFNICRICF